MRGCLKLSKEHVGRSGGAANIHGGRNEGGDWMGISGRKKRASSIARAVRALENDKNKGFSSSPGPYIFVRGYKLQFVSF